MGVVLGEELLVGLGAGPVGARVAPAIEQVAALAAAAAGVAGRLGRRRAVVDDPDLAERVHAHHDLVEVGVVGDRVEVGPVGIRSAAVARWAAALDFSFGVGLAISLDLAVAGFSGSPFGASFADGVGALPRYPSDRSLAMPSLVAIIGAIGPSPAPKLISTSSGWADTLPKFGFERSWSWTRWSQRCHSQTISPVVLPVGLTSMS